MSINVLQNIQFSIQWFYIMTPHLSRLQCSCLVKIKSFQVAVRDYWSSRMCLTCLNLLLLTLLLEKSFVLQLWKFYVVAASGILVNLKYSQYYKIIRLIVIKCFVPCRLYPVYLCSVEVGDLFHFSAPVPTVWHNDCFSKGTIHHNYTNRNHQFPNALWLYTWQVHGWDLIGFLALQEHIPRLSNKPGRLMKTQQQPCTCTRCNKQHVQGPPYSLLFVYDEFNFSTFHVLKTLTFCF